MEKKDLSSKDLLLSFLYSPGIEAKINEPITGRTKLTKMMYLFEKQLYSQFFEESIQIKLPDFEPYFFGPFSKQLFEDLAFFEAIGMINACETNIPISTADQIESSDVFDDEDEEATFDNDDKYELSYSLSQSGEKYVEEKIWIYFSSIQKDKLKTFKSQINKISLDALLRYVYNKYPEDAKRSLIADKYLDKADD